MQGALPFPLDEARCRLFGRARHALWHGALAIGIGPGDEVLMPAWHHGSEVEALRQTGARCRFYDVAEEGAPDPEELDALIGPATRCLYLIHYAGFPQDVAAWRSFADDRGLLLLEDCAHAFLACSGGEPVGRRADLAVFSLHHSLPLPDGAALLARRVPAQPPWAGIGVAPLARHLAWCIAHALPPAVLRHRTPNDERDLRLGDPRWGPSSVTRALLPRVADPSLADRRRQNAAILLDELADLVPEPFGHLSEGAVPLVLPVESGSKRRTLARVRERGVVALDLWPRPHPSLPLGAHPGAGRRRDTTIGLPVHQRLRARDLERIIDAVGHAVRPRLRQGLRVEHVGDMAAIRDEWNGLACASENVFQTFEWAAAWWDRFGSGRRPLIWACRTPSGRLAGVIPLYVPTRGGPRVARLIGHGLGAHVGPICAPPDRHRVALATEEMLERHGIPGLLAEGLPAEEHWGGLLGATVLRRWPSPAVRLEASTWEGFLASRTANFRQQVRRRERRLARGHEVSFRLISARDDLDDAFSTLVRLHEDRWGARSSVFAGDGRAFHRDVAQRALARGWLRLWLLELDGEPVAAWHGFRIGGVEWYYQAGRARAASDLAPGFVLLAHTLREAIADGVREYRMGSGGEPYKSRFADHDPGLETVIRGRGVVGRAAAAAGSAAANVRPLRRSLGRRLGR